LQVVADGSHGTNSNDMLILQQSSTDASGSLVVYSLVEENVMRGIMGGADSSIFLLPSGFAILPDGHGKAHYTAVSSSSSAPNNGEGALLTVASLGMLSSSPSGGPAARSFDDAGEHLCNMIKKIRDAVGANNVIMA
jgi:homeobox-leucine zipper protein